MADVKSVPGAAPAKPLESAKPAPPAPKPPDPIIPIKDAQTGKALDRSSPPPKKE